MGSVVGAHPPVRPRVIELIGPAGAGKSEVCAQLARMPDVLCTSIWNVPLTELAWATISTIPSAAMLVKRARAPLSRELRHIARLRALLNFLDRDEMSAYRYIVLDEGPIFTLSWLHVIGHQAFADFRTNSWRHYIAALWAATLDEVIWLDAPDKVLAHRLRTRAKRHVMSNASDRSVTAFSMRYRTAFNSALAVVQQHGRVAVREYRTDHHAPAELVDLMLGGSEPVELREVMHG